MKILFLSDTFPPEICAGANRVFEQARYWVEQGHEVTVITCAPNFPRGKIYPGYKNKWYQVEEQASIRVIRVKTFLWPNRGLILRTIDFLTYMLMSFVSGLFQEKPDIVIATSPQLFTAVSGWLLSRCKRVPFIFELADLWPASIGAVQALQTRLLLKIFEKLELFLYQRAEMVMALTSAFKTDLVRRKIPEKLITVIPSGVDLRHYHYRPKDENLLEQLGLKNKFVVGYIGTHGMAHGLENILEVAYLLHEDPDIHFLFVGDGAMKPALQALAKEKRLTNVLFIAGQSKTEIVKYWSICDLALVHLRNEEVFSKVIPSKLLEAVAMELPVLLISPSGEASEIVMSHEVGVWLEYGDVLQQVEVIAQLKDNAELLAEYRRHSKQHSSQYSRDKQAQFMLDNFIKVIEKTRYQRLQPAD